LKGSLAISKSAKSRYFQVNVGKSSEMMHFLILLDKMETIFIIPGITNATYFYHSIGW
jgi:hypothetical protein